MCLNRARLRLKVSVDFLKSKGVTGNRLESENVKFQALLLTLFFRFMFQVFATINLCENERSFVCRLLSPLGYFTANRVGADGTQLLFWIASTRIHPPEEIFYTCA